MRDMVNRDEVPCLSQPEVAEILRTTVKAITLRLNKPAARVTHRSPLTVPAGRLGLAAPKSRHRRKTRAIA